MFSFPVCWETESSVHLHSQHFASFSSKFQTGLSGIFLKLLDKQTLTQERDSTALFIAFAEKEIASTTFPLQAAFIG